MPTHRGMLLEATIDQEGAGGGAKRINAMAELAAVVGGGGGGRIRNGWVGWQISSLKGPWPPAAFAAQP